MSKLKKIIITLSIILILGGVAGYFLYQYIKDETRLTVEETEWINNNKSTIQNISIVNNVNIFGNTGNGVFYDFFKNLKKKYSLDFNYITFNSGSKMLGIYLDVGNNVSNNDIVFYEDHYVVIMKNSNENVNKIGVIGTEYDYLKSYITQYENNVINYASKEDLLEKFEKNSEINAIILPMTEYLDLILEKDYVIVNHLSDAYRYYYLSIDDSTFGTILKKEFEIWKKKSLEESLQTHKFNLFVNKLNITTTEIDKLQSIQYNYGFINTAPYELLSGGNYGGIIAETLNEFSSFADVDFSYKKYDNYKKFTKGLEKESVDIYFSYYNIDDSYKKISSNYTINYDVLYPTKESTVISSLNSLQGKTVYIEANTILYQELSKLNLFEIKTYETNAEMKKIVKSGGILIMDKTISNFLLKGDLDDYSVRFTGTLNTEYHFKSNQSDIFNKLFAKFLNTLDENTLINKGIYNYNVTLKRGTLVGGLAKYILYLLLIVVVIFIMIYRSSKRIRLAKKIKKEDKIKFIDQLTLLKNRNYLNENLANWNKNTIYPQAVIVIDLNKLQEINDTLGYDEGDNQIKATSNILIKTQIDNSDIIRTDGNEFLIYLVGYDAKKVTSYIYKLNKEFKSLPYEYGASIGYSMIENNLKSIEDAMNEAVESLKKQKEEKKENENEKN